MTYCKGIKQRRCNETPPGKIWYISHHAVYHPSKPGKKCVVFDCSAEFEGKLINKELLSGPGLTNQIFSILIRFREEKVAAMADVESMYHQVQVSENQQTYLKFLWWENQDIEFTQNNLSCVHMPSAVLLVEVVPIMFYVEQQWTMRLNLEKLLQVHSLSTSI